MYNLFELTRALILCIKMFASSVFWIAILFNISTNSVRAYGITYNGIPVPDVVRIVEHNTVDLKCSNPNTSQGAIWWMQENNENSRFYHPNLRFSGARLVDAGVWLCGTFNATLSIWTVTASVEISILYPVVAPKTYAVLPRKNVSLEAHYTYLFAEEKVQVVCTADSNPPAIYQWLTDGTPGNTGVARGSTLTFQEQASMYPQTRICEATTELTPTFAARSVVVKHKTLNFVVMLTPTIQADESQTLNTGGTLVVDCGFNNTQEFQTNVTWTKGLIKTISNTSTLTVRDVQPEDAGNYVCTAQVTQTSVTGVRKNYVLTRTVSVKVTDAPSIPKILFQSNYFARSLVVLAGEHVELSCVYNDKTDVDIRWTKPFDPTFLHGQPLLVIYSITSNQSGLYGCTVFENEKPTRKTTSIDIQVQTPASVYPLSQGEATEGDTFSIECKADGEPTPYFWWVKQGDEEFIVEDALLFLPSVTFQDTGIYFCYAENKIQTTFATNSSKYRDSRRMTLRVQKTSTSTGFIVMAAAGWFVAVVSGVIAVFRYFSYCSKRKKFSTCNCCTADNEDMYASLSSGTSGYAIVTPWDKQSSCGVEDEVHGDWKMSRCDSLKSVSTASGYITVGRKSI